MLIPLDENNLINSTITVITNDGKEYKNKNWPANFGDNPNIVSFFDKDDEGRDVLVIIPIAHVKSTSMVVEDIDQ